jgi:hypothetical protein
MIKTVSHIEENFVTGKCLFLDFKIGNDWLILFLDLAMNVKIFARKEVGTVEKDEAPVSCQEFGADQPMEVSVISSSINCLMVKISTIINSISTNSNK